MIPKHAIQVFEHMRVQDAWLQTLFACLYHAFELFGEREVDSYGLELYKKMVRLQVVANIQVVNDLKKALRLREAVEAKGLCPSVVTYNSIIRKLCEEGIIRDANRILNEMSDKNVEPDSITCNTLINAYSKIGDVRSAMEVKNKVLEAGLKLNQFTFKALIHGFCKV
ncbi:hypothetical protein SLEP1_g10622 [Rubroshorea leprosula]|uniref:Pentatricopeptide repeat-containing protein n=1 Tax=Rubroshorea leprosula TaxID=152421 RepID=A0AAV5IK07_9ROSI|nr:hypothetical protein SLEP1_g10622 [Rubroshorea leprosula]